MNKKVIFQIFLLFIISSIIAFLFFQLSLNKTSQSVSSSKVHTHSSSNLNLSNTMNNIEYKSYDAIGNQYLIRAKFGSISDENPNLILMKNVEAEIYFSKKEKISEQEIQLRRIKSLPFYWQLSQKNKLV